MISRQVFRSRRGQSLSEYLGVTALVAVAGITVIALFGGSLQTQFGNMTREIAGSSEQSEEQSTSSEQLLDIYDPDDPAPQTQDGNSENIEAEGVEIAAWPSIGRGAAKALECAKNPSCRKAVKEGAEQAVKKGRDVLNRSRPPKGAASVPKRVDPNKLKHIFGQERHNLSGVVKQFGSEEKAFNAIQQATETAVRSQGLKGVFETIIKVGTETITVRGNVLDGAVKIGTAFIP